MSGNLKGPIAQQVSVKCEQRTVAKAQGKKEIPFTSQIQIQSLNIICFNNVPVSRQKKARFITITGKAALLSFLCSTCNEIKIRTAD